jgi:hypothetical protein
VNEEALALWGAVAPENKTKTTGDILSIYIVLVFKLKFFI